MSGMETYTYLDINLTHAHMTKLQTMTTDCQALKKKRTNYIYLCFHAKFECAKVSVLVNKDDNFGLFFKF